MHRFLDRHDPALQLAEYVLNVSPLSLATITKWCTVRIFLEQEGREKCWASVMLAARFCQRRPRAFDTLPPEIYTTSYMLFARSDSTPSLATIKCYSPDLISLFLEIKEISPFR